MKVTVWVSRWTDGYYVHFLGVYASAQEAKDALDGQRDEDESEPAISWGRTEEAWGDPVKPGADVGTTAWHTFLVEPWVVAAEPTQ